MSVKDNKNKYYSHTPVSCDFTVTLLMTVLGASGQLTLQDLSSMPCSLLSDVNFPFQGLRTFSMASAPHNQMHKL